MNSQIIYKPKINIFVLNLFNIAVLAFIIVLVKSFDFEKTLAFIGIILSLSILFVIFKKRLTQITLNITSNELILILKKLHNTSTIKISLDEVRFSFKKEIGARGLKHKQLKIYKDKILIISLTPNICGWDENCIYKLLEDVKQLKPNLIIES